MLFKSNAAHKNRLMIPSIGFLLLYALNIGENWMKLAFSLIFWVKKMNKLVRVQSQALG